MSKKKKLNLFLNIILIVSIIICSITIVFKSTFLKVIVIGNSMEPTIEDGSIGYMVKVKADSKIDRFDIVACQDDFGPNYLIKRVVGLPNEKVSLIANRLYINDCEISQDFSFTMKDEDFKNTTFNLKDNEYLIVGDNRANTMEPIIRSKENIIAKNGFCIGKYLISSDKCNYSGDYSSCPIDNRKWYWFKNGK